MTNQTTINPAGYAVVQVGYAIVGAGATPGAAVADACEWLEDPITLAAARLVLGWCDDVGGASDRVIGTLRLMPASAALLAATWDDTSDPSSYDEIDGVLVTAAEADAVIGAD